MDFIGALEKIKGLGCVNEDHLACVLRHLPDEEFIPLIRGLEQWRKEVVAANSGNDTSEASAFLERCEWHFISDDRQPEEEPLDPPVEPQSLERIDRIIGIVRQVKGG